MLTILGDQQTRFCDGLSRRGFLRIGSQGLGGLSLARLMQAETPVRRSSTQRSVVMIYLPGGPTQHETFDPKPAAPREIRGSFGPTSTSVPGVRYCELLPKLSAMAAPIPPEPRPPIVRFTCRRCSPRSIATWASTRAA